MTDPTEHRPFTIGLDLDGTTADYHRGLWRWLCAVRGTPGRPFVPLSDYTDFAQWGLDRTLFTQAHQTAVADGLFVELDVLDGAAEALGALAGDGVTIRVVTARAQWSDGQSRAYADTARWLCGANPQGAIIPHDEIMFTSRKHVADCDVWIDDAPDQIAALHATVGPDRVIVFDQPYNRGMAGQRATSWEQIPEMIGRLRTGLAQAA